MNPSELRHWLSKAPEGAVVTLPAAELRAALECDAQPVTPTPAASIARTSWRERLWSCPAETRLNRDELSEALGRPASWIYRHTSSKSGKPLLPHVKLDGELNFIAGQVRAWIREHEEVVAAGPMESTADERRASLRAS